MNGFSKRFWIGVAISVLLLAVFVLTVDLGRMLEALADANYLYLVPGVGMYLISVLFRTLRWQVLLRHMRLIPVSTLYPIVVVGYMANNLLPMRMGELVRSYYVGERQGISKTSALATIFVERVMDAVTLLLFVAAIALFVPLAGLAEGFEGKVGIGWPLLVAATSIPFVVAFAALLLFAYYPAWARSATTVLVRPLPARFQAPLLGIITLLLHGLVPLRSPRTLGRLLLLSVPIWLFEAALFFFVGLAFGLNHLFDSLGEMAVAKVLVTAIANIGSSVPAAPGGIGLFELVTRETLVLLPQASIDRSVAAGFATVVHAALLLPMILLGQVFLWVSHLSLSRLSRLGRAGNTGKMAPEATEEGIPHGALSYEGDETP